MREWGEGTKQRKVWASGKRKGGGGRNREREREGKRYGEKEREIKDERDKR